MVNIYKIWIKGNPEEGLRFAKAAHVQASNGYSWKSLVDYIESVKPYAYLYLDFKFNGSFNLYRCGTTKKDFKELKGKEITYAQLVKFLDSNLDRKYLEESLTEEYSLW